jgi:hypothetical protein
MAWALAASPAAAAEALRDPFVFGSRKTTEPVVARLVLNGILWDATRPLAIVGGEAVAVGDTVGGWQVTAIQPNRIVIQRGKRREVLDPGAALPAE